jgi:hypothetical protein
MTRTLMNIIDDIPNFSISGYWSKLVFLDYDINDYILKNLFKTFFFFVKNSGTVIIFKCSRWWFTMSLFTSNIDNNYHFLFRKTRLIVLFYFFENFGMLT